MKKILVVEDNETNMYLWRRILKNGGYEVIPATSGEEAIELAIKEKPDLILMDIQLPGIDGLEATRRIRKSEVDGEIPIIAITSYAMTGDKEKALSAGYTDTSRSPLIQKFS